MNNNPFCLRLRKITAPEGERVAIMSNTRSTRVSCDGDTQKDLLERCPLHVTAHVTIPQDGYLAENIFGGTTFVVKELSNYEPAPGITHGEDGYYRYIG